MGVLRALALDHRRPCLRPRGQRQRGAPTELPVDSTCSAVAGNLGVVTFGGLVGDALFGGADSDCGRPH